MPNGETGDFIESRRGICLEHFSIRLTSTVIARLDRSRACPTSVLNEGSKSEVSDFDWRSSKHRPWLLDSPVKPGNDTGRVNLERVSMKLIHHLRLTRRVGKAKSAHRAR